MIESCFKLCALRKDKISSEPRARSSLNHVVTMIIVIIVCENHLLIW